MQSTTDEQPRSTVTHDATHDSSSCVSSLATRSARTTSVSLGEASACP